jgi:hypothetical protein
LLYRTLLLHGRNSKPARAAAAELATPGRIVRTAEELPYLFKSERGVNRRLI